MLKAIISPSSSLSVWVSALVGLLLLKLLLLNRFQGTVIVPKWSQKNVFDLGVSRWRGTIWVNTLFVRFLNCEKSHYLNQSSKPAWSSHRRQRQRDGGNVHMGVYVCVRLVDSVHIQKRVYACVRACVRAWVIRPGPRWHVLIIIFPCLWCSSDSGSFVPIKMVYII